MEQPGKREWTGAAHYAGLEDAALVRLLANRADTGEDPGAMRELIRRYDAPLRRFLFHLLGDPEDTEDVLCDVFTRLWRSAPRFKGSCSVGTWVFRIASSAATDLLRQRRAARRAYTPAPLDGVTSVPAGPGDEPERAALSQEWEERSRALVAGALEALSPEERVAVTLHHLEGCSYQEVASRTGVPVTTARMRLFRARRKMEAFVRSRLEAEETPRFPVTPGAASGSRLPLLSERQPAR